MAHHYQQGGAPPSLLDYLRDIRVIAVIAQIVFIILVVLFFSVLWTNVITNLEDRNLTPNWDVIELRRGGMPIDEAPEWYSPDEKYGVAFQVGVVNTLRIVSVGLVAATALGVLFGIFLLSNNWLIRTITRAYVEIIRNTPLLLQLIFIYFSFFLTLPAVRDAAGLPQEGVAIIPYRLPLYVLILIGVWYAARNAHYPSRLFGGAILVTVLMEIVFAIMGYSSVYMAMFAGLGILAFVISWFAPRSWGSVLLGISIIPLLQVVFHIAFHMLTVIHVIPNAEAIITDLQSVIFPTARGIFFPEFLPNGARYVGWFAFVAIGIVAVYGFRSLSNHITETTGRQIRQGLIITIMLVVFIGGGWALISSVPNPETVIFDEAGTAIIIEEALEADALTRDQLVEVSTDPIFVSLPERSGFRITGNSVSLPFIALLVGLIINASAPIAEVVRAGIQAVPHGQTEAARAVGLSTPQVLWNIILPQAMRVIIPPMGNQYLNLAKNSSLGLAVAYADTYQVSQTMMNQSGQSVTGFALVLIVYLSMSLVISLFMNVVNSRFQLVTR